MKELNQKNPFKTPEGYFEDFSNALLKRLPEKDTYIPENEGFIVPDAYFEGVHEHIRQRLEAEETKVIPLHPYKKLYFAAASIAAVALVVFMLNSNTSQEITFEDIANSEIDTYFEINSLDFSPYEIAEVVPVDELEISDLMSNTFNEDVIFNYLDSHTDEFEELNLEYDE
ncbi:hypothetical protein [Pricia sp.]|uniref:hypothetical protein n=1 Tax=Pricia sp. TaxID=2268138 RepID=UPI003593D2C1